MSNNNEEKKFKISPRVLSISERISGLQGVGVEGGEFKDPEVFRKIATEDGRNVDQIMDDQDYISDFIAGNAHAHGKLGFDHHRDNKDASGTLTGSFEIGRHRMEMTIERHQRVPNRVLDRDSGHFKVDGEKDLYGDINVKYKARGAKNSAGELKVVREYVGDIYSRGGFSS